MQAKENTIRRMLISGWRKLAVFYILRPPAGVEKCPPQQEKVFTRAGSAATTRRRANAPGSREFA